MSAGLGGRFSMSEPLPTVREFEKALRSVGLNRREVSVIMHEGYIALVKQISASRLVTNVADAAKPEENE